MRFVVEKMAHFYSVSNIPAVLQPYIQLHVAHQKTNMLNLGTFQKAISFGHWGALDRNALSPFYVQRAEHHRWIA
jgi:hypothetical protein